MKTAITLLFGISLGIPAMAQDNGIQAEWDIRGTIQSVSTHIERLEPILEQVRAQEWIPKGAPEAYVAQLKTAKDLVSGVKLSTTALSKEPERLTIALDTYFRLQSLDSTLGSLAEGVGKYQNPALAELLSGILAESGGSRQQLRQYMVDLATTKEEEFQVMDKEAQRCRGVLVKQPSGAARRPVAPAKKGDSK